MTDPLLRFRAEFPILETHDLPRHQLARRHAAHGARPAGGVRATRGRARRARVGERWWEMPVTRGRRDRAAHRRRAGRGGDGAQRLDRAGAGAARRSTTRAPRDTIVMTALDFPSVRYVYDELAARLGARIVVVPSDDGIGDRRGAAARGDRRAHAARRDLARAVPVGVRDGRRRESAAHAHAMGALVSLDAFHSVGVLPVDVNALGVDFLTGGVLKWLCGGPGGCFLWRGPPVSATPGAGAHRLAGARAAVRVRAGDGVRRRRVALAGRHAGDSRAVRRHRRSAHPARGGHRGDAREEHAADVAADRAGRRARLSGDRAARPGPPRRHGRVRRPARATRWRRPARARHHRRLSGRARASASRRTSTRATTSSRRWWR